MKINLYKLVLLLTVLFILGCTSSDEEPFLESNKQNETANMNDSNRMEYLKKMFTTQDELLKKGTNNGNGVQWVLQYSGSPYYPGFQANIVIPNTMMVMFIDYPLVGDDVAKIQGEWMMTNWNLTEPRVFIADFSNGLGEVVFSNWCDEVRTGKSHQNSRVKYDVVDLDGINGPDYYFYNPYDKDSDVSAHLETTLTDAQLYEPGAFPIQDDCRTPTERVDLRYSVKIKNGVWKVDVELDGVKYSNNKKLKN